MNMENTTFGTPIASVLFEMLVVVLLILIIIVVARSIRRADTPHQKEMRQLLGQIANALEENNRLLHQKVVGKQSDEKRENTPPAG
jgi:membrane protein implicated in regulation of membrane protease activity